MRGEAREADRVLSSRRRSELGVLQRSPRNLVSRLDEDRGMKLE